jgi:UPF0271 protein
VSARIDLNADMGEGFGRWRLTDDRGLLRIVTSANIACGFHAGDPRTMLTVAAEAAECGVAIGAHVGYRDLAGFGRRAMDVPTDELEADVLYQVAALAGCCSASGTKLRYVKQHGDLYNTTAHDARQAAAVVAGVRRHDASLPVLGLPGSALLSAATAAGLDAVAEGFPDRAYTAEGTLVPRSEPGAVLHDPEEIARRGVCMAVAGEVETRDGAVARVRARSLCVHGDEPGAVEAATQMRRALTSAGVELAPFA